MTFDTTTKNKRLISVSAVKGIQIRLENMISAKQLERVGGVLLAEDDWKMLWVDGKLCFWESRGRISNEKKTIDYDLKIKKKTIRNKK